MAAGATAMTMPRQASAAVPGYDPMQRLLRLVGGGNGIIYAVQADGTLGWLRHFGWKTGSGGWANHGTPRPIGNGFHQFEWVGAAYDGTIYGLTGDGNVYLYRYVLRDPNTGVGYWQNHGVGVRVASGWTFPRVFGGPDNVLWTVDEQGRLYRAPLTGGSLRPSRVGNGFEKAWYLMSDTGGVIYAVTEGNLSWLRYQGPHWLHHGMPIDIGSGWLYPSQIQVTCAGSGAMYLLIPDPDHVPERDGALSWLRLTNPLTVASDNRAKWTARRVVGNGFTLQRTAALHGYALTASVAAGQDARFAVSSTVGAVDAAVVRCDTSASLPTVSVPATVSPGLQRLRPDFRSAGCGWQETAGTRWTANVPSGVYALALSGPKGMRRYVPFVVRPARPGAPIAVVLPTNTYNAYNAWGGHSAYTPSNIDHPRVLSWMRPAQNLAVRPEGRVRAELYSDLLLLRWMTAQGIRYDVYTDPDLDANPGLLASYQALVLGSHAEYWTQGMRDALVAYENGGGRVISTGGNAVYERVVCDNAGQTVQYRTSSGARDLFLNAGLPQSQVLGVEYDGSTLFTFAPYKVMNNHPLLAGTGLRPGDTFGAAGFNGAASGWETDLLLGEPGQARPAEVIAQGTNPGRRGGAVMALLNRPNGGFVFTASSISFNGALADPKISTIMSNVFAAALSANPAIATRPAAPPSPAATTPARTAPRQVTPSQSVEKPG